MLWVLPVSERRRLWGGEGVCACRGWALGDVPQADAVSPRFLEGLPQAPEDIRVVLGRGEVAGVDSQGVKRIGQHGFPSMITRDSSYQVRVTAAVTALNDKLM